MGLTGLPSGFFFLIIFILILAAAAKMIRKIIRKKKPEGRPVKPILFPPYSIFLTLNFSLPVEQTHDRAHVCIGCGLVQIAPPKREKIGTFCQFSLTCNR